MSSTTPSPSAILSSSRTQRLMVWISGAVLVVGIGIFLAAFLSRGTGQAAVTSTLAVSTPLPTPSQPGSHQPSTAHVPPARTALQVVRTFLETAVPRKHLDVAYGLVGPALKAGTSRAEWLKGNNPVTYFPASNLKTAQLDVKSSTKDDIWLIVGLKAAPGSGVAPSVKALGCEIEVARMHGKWLVNYFLCVAPNQHLPTPQ